MSRNDYESARQKRQRIFYPGPTPKEPNDLAAFPSAGQSAGVRDCPAVSGLFSTNPTTSSGRSNVSAILIKATALIVGAACSLGACDQLTGTKPPAVPCHGDTVSVSLDSLKTDSVMVVRAHVCGTPRDA